MSDSPQQEALWSCLNSLMGKEEPHPFLIERFRWEADKLLKEDPLGGHQALGALASISSDVEEMRRQHGLAVVLSHGDPRVRMNYAISLGHMGYFSQAVRLFRQCQEETGESADFLPPLVHYLVQAGRFRDAAHWLEEMKREELVFSAVTERLIGGAVALLEQRDISDDLVEDLQQEAIRFLHANLLYPSVVNFRLIREEQGERLVGIIPVKLTPVAVTGAELEWFRLCKQAPRFKPLEGIVRVRFRAQQD